MIPTTPRKSIAGTQSVHTDPEITAEIVGGAVHRAGTWGWWQTVEHWAGHWMDMRVIESKACWEEGANLPAYIRTMGIVPLSFVESKVSLVKTRVTRSLFPPPACPTIS